MNVIDRIINNVVSKVIKESMLREYKNQEDCDIVRQYADGLQQMHDRIVKGGLSRHEITMVTLDKIIRDLRNLEHQMSL